MAFTYDVTSDAGQVRLLATDTDEAEPLFSDAEISAFLTLEGSSVRRAAALALETIASQQALLLKVIRRLDVETDGAKVSDSLLKRADKLRVQADEDDARDGESFDVIEMADGAFAERERIHKQWLRRA